MRECPNKRQVVSSQKGTRICLLLFTTLGNWVFLLCGAILRPKDYDTFLVGIFLFNLVLYVIFYLTMKVKLFLNSSILILVDCPYIQFCYLNVFNICDLFCKHSLEPSVIC